MRFTLFKEQQHSQKQDIFVVMVVDKNRGGLKKEMDQEAP
jgi:hypothetical protein